MSWADRVAERSPMVQRSRSRSVQQAKLIVDAAGRLVAEKGESFTIKELVKEAGVALQTFYRYFGSKDELLLAVFEDIIATGCADMEKAARRLPDPLARLRSYINAAVRTRGGPAFWPRFVTAEHWRLYQLYPAEMAEATQPFSDLVLRQIREAEDAGLLHSRNPERDAWLINKLVVAVFHHYAFAPPEQPSSITDDVWEFCLAALGGMPRRRRK